MSNYVPRMGLQTSPWDDSIFVSKGCIACENVTCVNWPPASPHQIGDTVHVPKDLSKVAALISNPDTNLIGPFYPTEANVKPLRILKTIYLPVSFIGIFLDGYITLVEAWTQLRSALFKRGLEVYCCPKIDWIFVAPTQNTGDDKSALAMP